MSFQVQSKSDKNVGTFDTWSRNDQEPLLWYNMWCEETQGSTFPRSTQNAARPLGKLVKEKYLRAKQESCVMDWVTDECLHLSFIIFKKSVLAVLFLFNPSRHLQFGSV